MNKPLVLVVDDESRMRDLIRLYLQGEYRVAEAADGMAALRSVLVEEPALVILDLMLPGMDGKEVCRRLRERSAVPVIMLTARGDISDRIEGLKIGADDYIVKPFDGRELQARVATVLRRVRGEVARDVPLHRGELTLHPAERIVMWRQTPVNLTAKEFDLLWLLAANPGQVFTRDRLLDRVWGPEYGRDLRTVDSHVRNIREKLGAGGAYDSWRGCWPIPRRTPASPR